MKRLVVVMLLAAATTAACKDSTAPANPDPGTGTVVQLRGTLATPIHSGEIEITVAANPDAGGGAAITGCMFLGTPTCVAVTGAYSVAAKSLTFATSGPSLVFQGAYAAGVADGSVTGAGGDGSFALRTGTATVYCGSFTGTVDGTWNTVVGTSAVVGVFVNEFGNSGVLTGTVSGTSVTATADGGLTSSGTLSGTSASGTWSFGIDNGTWSGTTGNCR